MEAETTTRNVFSSRTGILHVATEDQPTEGMIWTQGTLDTGWQSRGAIRGSSRIIRKEALTPAGILVSESHRKGQYFPDAAHT